MTATPGYCIRNEMIRDLPTARRGPDGRWRADRTFVENWLRSLGMVYRRRPKLMEHRLGVDVTCEICGPLPVDLKIGGFHCSPEKHRRFYDELEAKGLEELGL